MPRICPVCGITLYECDPKERWGWVEYCDPDLGWVWRAACFPDCWEIAGGGWY